MANTSITEIVNNTPVIDIHTHLGDRGFRQARNLADIVAYHWIHLEINRAGGQTPFVEVVENPDEYLHSVVPHFKLIRNTANHWCLMQLLKDLYGFDERTLTESNWESLDKKVREDAKNKNRLNEVLTKSKITKLSVPITAGIPDDSGKFIPYEYGEYLFAPTTPLRFMELVSHNSGQIPDSITEVSELIVNRIKFLRKNNKIKILHFWIRESWVYKSCKKNEAEILFHRMLKGINLTLEEDNRLVSFFADTVAEIAAELGITLQVFHGMDFYGSEAPKFVASHSEPEFVRSLPRFASEHKSTSIDLFLATRLSGFESASISRTSSNLSVSGAWWHGFTPTTLGLFFRDRLEMLPHNSWNAFFSDGYIVEWIYGKLLLSKNRLAKTLSDYVEEGFLEIDDIPEIAQNLLHDNPKRIYGL